MSDSKQGDKPPRNMASLDDITPDTVELLLAQLGQPGGATRVRPLDWRYVRRFDPDTSEPDASVRCTSALEPGSGRIADAWSQRTASDGRFHGRFVVTGVPASGKTSVANDVARGMLDKLLDAGDDSGGTEALRQFPIPIHAREALGSGVQTALADAFFQSYGVRLPPVEFEEAVRAGELVPLVDGIEEWGNGERLNPSAPLMSELLRIVGLRAPFLATVDSRCIYVSLFDTGRVTNLGDRCRDADDIDLVELAPFVGRKHGESFRGAFLRQRCQLPEVATDKDATDPPDDPLGHRGTHVLQSWFDAPEGRELLPPGTRRELTDEIALEQFRNAASSVPFERISNLTYDKTPSELRDIRHLESILELVFRSPLFTGDQRKGLSFASQHVWETSLVGLMARTVLNREGIDEDFLMILGQGILTERMALSFWLRPEIRRNKAFHHGRMRRLLNTGHEALHPPREERGRNAILGLLRLYIAYKRLRDDSQMIPMPDGVNLEGAELDEIDFSNLEMKNWCFDDAVLQSPHFVGSRFVGVSFQRALAPAMLFWPKEMRGLCNFFLSSLVGSLIQLPDEYEDVNFSRADLSGSWLICNPGSNRLTRLEEALKGAVGSDCLLNDQPWSSEASRLDAVALAALYHHPEIRLVGDRYLVELEKLSDGLTRVHIEDASKSESDGTTASGPRLDIEDRDVQFTCEVTEIGERARCKPAFVVEGKNGAYLVEHGQTKPWSVRGLPGHLGSLRSVVRFGDGRRLALVGSDKSCWLTEDGQSHDLPDPWPSILFAQTVSDLPNQLIAVIASQLDVTASQLMELGLKYAEASGGGKLRPTLGGIRRLFRTPSLLTTEGNQAAAAYEDQTVQVFSRRFGWTSLGHHLLSLRSILDLQLMVDRRLLLAIGEWTERGQQSTNTATEGERELGACLLDSRAGNVIVYFNVPDIEPEDLKERLRALARQFVNRAQTEKLAERDWCEGRFEGSERGGDYILKRLAICLPEKTYTEGRDVQVTFDLMPRKPLNVVRKVYETRVDQNQMPLNLGLVVTSPDGTDRSIPSANVHIHENGGKGLQVSFPWRFEQIGDHRLSVSMYLGPAVRGEIVPSRLQARPLNPYYHGVGIGEDDNRYLFVGHARLLKQLEREARQSTFMVCGSRRQGKSSLLKMLKHSLRSGGQGETVVVDLSFDQLERGGPNDPNASARDFVHGIFRGIVADEEYCSLLEVETPPEIATVKGAKDSLSRLLENLPTVYGRSARLVVLVDEFNTFLKFGDHGETIGSFIESFHGQGFRVVSFGLPFESAGEVDIRQNSGIFRFFTEKLYMDPLDDREIERLATDPVHGRFGIEDSALQELVRRAAGRPFDAQVMLRKGLDRTIDDDREAIRTEDIVNAFETDLSQIYGQDYSEVFNDFEAQEREEAQEWKRMLAPDVFWESVQEINSWQESESRAFSLFFEQGYVKARGRTLHIPPALLHAWVRR